MVFESCALDDADDAACLISRATFLDDERDTFGDGLLDGMDETDVCLSPDCALEAAAGGSADDEIVCFFNLLSKDDISMGEVVLEADPFTGDCDLVLANLGEELFDWLSAGGGCG